MIDHREDCDACSPCSCVKHQLSCAQFAPHEPHTWFDGSRWDCPGVVSPELDSTRLERLRMNVKDELAESVWWVDGQRVEAADRHYWLNMQWLLGKLDEVTAYAARLTTKVSNDREERWSMQRHLDHAKARLEKIDRANDEPQPDMRLWWWPW